LLKGLIFFLHLDQWFSLNFLSLLSGMSWGLWWPRFEDWQPYWNFQSWIWCAIYIWGWQQCSTAAGYFYFLLSIVHACVLKGTSSLGFLYLS
jgi:hypothetical protein